jgi:CheY-like chemotaxis protein
MKAMDEIQIVIIEDNIDNIELITSLLTIDVGITRYTSWDSGQSFFKWFYDIFLADPQRQDIDLILLDLQMPRENGYEIFKKIKQEPLLRKALIGLATWGLMDLLASRLALSDSPRKFSVFCRARPCGSRINLSPAQGVPWP